MMKTQAEAVNIFGIKLSLDILYRFHNKMFFNYCLSINYWNFMMADFIRLVSLECFLNYENIV